MLNSLCLSIHNWKVWLKSILYQMIILAMVCAIVFACFGNTIDATTEVFDGNNLGVMANEIADAIKSGEFDSGTFSQQLLEFSAKVSESIGTIKQQWGAGWVMYLVILLFVVAYRMLVSATDVVVGCQLEEFMTSNASRPFFWYAVKKFGKTWAFSLYQMLIVLPLDALLLFGSIGIYIVMFVAFGWSSPIPLAIIAWLVYSARLALCGYMLPSAVCQEELPVRKAITSGLSDAVNRFFPLLGKTLIITGVMALGNGLLLEYAPSGIVGTVCVSAFNFVMFFVVKCVNFVDYFIYNDKPYFFKRLAIEGTDKFNRIQQRKEKRLARRNAQ